MVALKPRQVSFLIDQGGIIPRAVSDGRGNPHGLDDFNVFQFFNAKECYRYQLPMVHIKNVMQYLYSLRLKRQSGEWVISPERKSFYPDIEPGTFLSIRPSEESPAKKPALWVAYQDDTDPGRMYDGLCKRKDQRSLFIIDLFKMQAVTLSCLKG